MSLSSEQYEAIVAAQREVLQGQGSLTGNVGDRSPFSPHFIVSPSFMRSNVLTMRAECVVPDVDLSFAPVMPIPIRPTSLANHLSKAGPGWGRTALGGSGRGAGGASSRRQCEIVAAVQKLGPF